MCPASPAPVSRPYPVNRLGVTYHSTSRVSSPHRSAPHLNRQRFRAFSAHCLLPVRCCFSESLLLAPAHAVSQPRHICHAARALSSSAAARAAGVRLLPARLPVWHAPDHGGLRQAGQDEPPVQAHDTSNQHRPHAPAAWLGPGPGPWPDSKPGGAPPEAAISRSASSKSCTSPHAACPPCSTSPHEARRVCLGLPRAALLHAACCRRKLRYG